MNITPIRRVIYNKTVITVACFIMTYGCTDPDWIILEDGGNYRVYVSRSSTRDGDFARASVRWGFDVDESTTVTEFNCKTNYTRDIETEYINYYDRSPPQKEFGGEWELAKDGSLMKRALSYACFNIRP